MIKVLFVCTGNICRSPMAEMIFRDMVKKAGLDDQIQADSAGISDEEVGNTMHRGTVSVLAEHGIPHSPKRYARQIMPHDFDAFDYVLAMDTRYLSYLKRHVGKSNAQVGLFLDEAKRAGMVTRDDVPDPWYDGQFDRTYDLITAGCTAFLARLRAEYGL